jgi:hypothetical protein
VPLDQQHDQQVEQPLGLVRRHATPSWLLLTRPGGQLAARMSMTK